MQNNYAIFCEKNKIIYRVFSEILDLSHYVLDDPRSLAMSVPSQKC